MASQTRKLNESLEKLLGKQFIWYDILSDTLVKYSDGLIQVWAQISLKLNSKGLYYIELKKDYKNVKPYFIHSLFHHMTVGISPDLVDRKSINDEINEMRKRGIEITLNLMKKQPRMFLCDNLRTNRISGISAHASL